MKSYLSFLILFVCLNGIAQTEFLHSTKRENISANYTLLDHPELNGKPDAIVQVYPLNGAELKNNNAIGVWYTGTKWSIFNQNRAVFPENIDYKIVFLTSASKTAFVHKVLNGGRSSDFLDNPLLNDNPQAIVEVTQNWNPVGSNGVYNNSTTRAEYDKNRGKWLVRNQNENPIPAGASFNIFVYPEGKTAKGGVISAIANEKISDLSKVSAPMAQELIQEGLLGFETGFSSFWTSTGSAFANQPVAGNTVKSERILKQMNYEAGGIGGDYWKGLEYKTGVKGNYWIGSSENGNGVAATGSLESKIFTAKDKYLTFLLGGGADLNKLYVELQVRKTDYEAAWGGPKRVLWGETPDGFVRVERVFSAITTDEFYRYWFDLGALLNNNFQGKAIRLRIVDEKTTNGGYINVDDFRFKSSINEFLKIELKGFSLYADADKPVFGFADTHAHWVNGTGLNNLMWGNTGLNWKTSSADKDIVPCNGYDHGIACMTPALLIMQTEKAAFNRIAERFADPNAALCALANLPAGIPFLTFMAFGALDAGITSALITSAANPAFHICGPTLIKNTVAVHYNNQVPSKEVGNFVDFPRWNTMFHQTMHISWVRRSYEGGQRLMVVPVGVAKSWEFNSNRFGQTIAAKIHLTQQIDELNRIVNANTDWLKIAKSAKEAREIIQSNKMAIVIAIEQAEIGSYDTDEVTEINWLMSLGVRHFFPIHNINNTLGGAAVFNPLLNGYNDLVNRQSQDAPIVPLEVREGDNAASRADNTYTVAHLDRQFLRQGIRFLPLEGVGNIPFFYINDVPETYNYDAFKGHKNKIGLTTKGERYIKTLMDKGLIIEIDHMSDLAQDKTMQLLQTRDYPMMAGHANFRELRRSEGTKVNEKLRTEFTIHDRRMDEIAQAGGMIGILNQQNDILSPPATMPPCPVLNNNTGSSASFAQAYWYVANKVGFERGIAFGSDFNGFAPQINPRFGTESAAILQDDKDRLNGGDVPIDGVNNLRRIQAFRQKNGVRYDTPINTVHYHRFPQPSFLTQEEREIWEALAMAKSGKAIESVWQPGGGLSVERTGMQQNKIKNLAYGFTTLPSNSRWLGCPDYTIAGGCPQERKAAFLVKNGLNALDASQHDVRTIELYHVIKPIYELWNQFENGPNEKLRRSYAFEGGRDFDFNLDGLAHFGMYPDFIQDLKNQGLKENHLQPLFLGAEEYIQLWEKCESKKQN